MRALAVVAAALVCAPLAGAQQRADTLVVTLEQALETARRNNPAYLRAAGQLELNRPETRAALVSGVLPSVSVNLLSTGYAGNLARRATDDFGNPIANPDAEYVFFSSTTQGLALNWQLRGPSPWHEWKRLRLANENRTLGEEIAREVLRREVDRRFYDALAQEELLAAELEIASASRMDLEAAQRLFELALRSRVDVLTAELQIEQQQLLVRRQQGARDQARLGLRTLLGQTGLPPVRPAPATPPLFDPIALDEAVLVGRAVRASAAVRQAEVDVRIAEVGVQESRVSYWPMLNANFSVGRLDQARRTESLFDFGGFEDQLYSNFSLGLSLPFFNNVFVNRAGMARAEVARQGEEDELRQARLETERSVRSALVTLRDSWDAVRIAERSRAIATERLELAREEYRLGTRTFAQLQQSVLNEATIQRQLIQARYGFVDALIDLEAAVGGPVR